MRNHTKADSFWNLRSRISDVNSALDQIKESESCIPTKEEQAVLDNIREHITSFKDETIKALISELRA